MEKEHLPPEIQRQVARAVTVLKKGGVVAYPTDTVYGLGAGMTCIAAIERIFEIKNRSRGMALPLLLADKSQIEDVVKSVPPSARRLIDNFLPGALTIILWKADIVPDIITAGGNTVAVRIPAHPVPVALIKGLGIPIVGTSANLSGQPSPRTAAAVRRQIGGKIDMLIDGGRCPGGIESTVVDLTGEKPVIRRQGAITIEQLKQACPEIVEA